MFAAATPGSVARFRISPCRADAPDAVGERLATIVDGFGAAAPEGIA